MPKKRPVWLKSEYLNANVWPIWLKDVWAKQDQVMGKSPKLSLTFFSGRATREVVNVINKLGIGLFFVQQWEGLVWVGQRLDMNLCDKRISDIISSLKYFITRF